MINGSYDKCRCRNKYLHETLTDPYALWDHFPCPPPESKHLLFKVNWSKKLGPKQGFKIMFRLAKRCNVEIPDMYHHPGHLGSSLVIIACETECYSKISIFCCILFFIILGIIIFCILRRKNNIPKKHADVLLAKKPQRDQILLSCEKKWVQVFVRKKKDKLIIDNRTKYFDDVDHKEETGIKTHSYHRFPCELDPPLRSRSMLTCDKANFHIYEDIDELKSSKIDQTLCKTTQHDNEDDNIESLIHPWDMQTFKRSSKSVISDIQDTSEDDISTNAKYYHTYDRLHTMPTGNIDARLRNDIANTGSDIANTGSDFSRTGTMGNKSQDKRFCSMNRNHIKQKHATISRKESSLSAKSNEKPVCIDYIETPIIFCV